MSLLLAAAMVMAALNVARIALTGEADMFGLVLNLLVLITAPIMAFAARDSR